MPRTVPSLDVLSIGDTMLDVFVEINEGAVHCKADKTSCQISFVFGEKIPVESMTRVPAAGNASNAAIAAARLGLSAAICSTIGDDPEGELIRKRWKEEAVSVRYVSQPRGEATNYSTVLSFRGERTILVHHNAYTYQFPKQLPPIRRIYYTSLGKGHETLERGLLAYLAQAPKTRLTFQPGTYQLRRLATGMAEVLQHSDIVVMNKEEAELFLGRPAKEPIKKQLKRLQALGPRVSVITDGEQGCYAIEGKKAWSCKSFQVPCVERTGAGDAYTSAFTWAIDKGFSVPEAMRYGTANASSVIQFLGPHQGLLNREGLNKVIRQHQMIRPRPFPL